MTNHQLTEVESTITEGELDQHTAFCSCGNAFVANTEERAREIQAAHAGMPHHPLKQINVRRSGGGGGGSTGGVFVPAANLADPMRRALETMHEASAFVDRVITDTEATDNAAQNPDIHELPALTTLMSGQQFHEWMEAPGQIFIVYLPGEKSFIIKVPDEHNAFFVAMMRQIRMVLGPKVIAQSASPVPTPNPPYAAYGAGPIVVGDVVGDAAPPAGDFPYPEMFTPADEPLRHTCPGSGRDPKPYTIHSRSIGRGTGRGTCKTCGGDYKLTKSGMIRAHRQAKP